MQHKRAIWAVLCALLIAELFLISDNRRELGGLYASNLRAYSPRDFIAPLPTSEKITATPTPEPEPAWFEHAEKDKKEALDQFEGLTSVFMELEDLGKHYITAYSPKETGSYMTASGIKLHRAEYANRYTEPTTCAVDRRLYKIGANGTRFYIPEFDRVFIAQDTGRLVKGKHLDLAYIDLKSVKSFPTGNYRTYKVINLSQNEYTKENVCQDYYANF